MRTLRSSTRLNDSDNVGKLFTNEPVKDAEAISHIAFGFMASKALFAGLDIELFAKLSQTPTSFEDLCSILPDVEPLQLETLTTTLCSIGLLVRDESGALSNPPAVEAFLSKRKPAWDFGDYLRYQIDKQMYPFMGDLPGLMNGKPAQSLMYKNYEEWMADSDAARLYTESQHSGSIGPAKSLSKLEGDRLGKVRSMIDVGGGSGGFAITLAKIFPELRINVLDFPNVCEVGREYADQAKDVVGDRVGFIPGNALDDPFPAGQDAVLMSYLSGSIPAATLEGVYKKAFEAANTGAVIFIHDFMVEDERSGPPLAALWALQHMVFTPGAKSLTPAFVESTLTNAGWSVSNTVELIPGMTKLTVATKS